MSNRSVPMNRGGALTLRPGIPQNTQGQVDYILLDGSGSMQVQWWDTLDAIEAYVQGVKLAGIDTHTILNVFSEPSNLEMIQRNCHIRDWTPLREDPIGSTFSSTALYDAVNLMMRNMVQMNPSVASLIIATDGEDGFSASTSLEQARHLLDYARRRGWQVTFIGANFDNSEVAGLLGGAPQSAIGVERTHLKEAAEELARKRVRHAASGAPMHWSPEEQQQFGGYLTKG